MWASRARTVGRKNNIKEAITVVEWAKKRAAAVLDTPRTALNINHFLGVVNV